MTDEFDDNKPGEQVSDEPEEEVYDPKLDDSDMSGAFPDEGDR